jgi:hypothetical protein
MEDSGSGQKSMTSVLFSSMSESRKTYAVLIAVFFLYFPFIFLGYGNDIDSWGVARSAQEMLTEHKYTPSRYPGYFTHEFASMFLILIGGSVGSNLGTLAMSLLTLYFFLMICEMHHIPNRHLLAVLLAVNPYYWVSSTCTIDYLWALGLLMAGYWCVLKKRYVPAGVLFGLAAGARMSSGLFVMALAASYFITREEEKYHVFASSALGGFVGVLMYVPSFIAAGYTLDFFTYYIDDWTGIEHLARFVYKNIYLFGLQTSVVLALLTPSIVKGLRERYREYNWNLLTLSVLMIIAFESLYFKIPLEMEYLLPMMPFLLILVGIALKEKVQAIIALIVVQASYNIISFNFARPDVPDHATEATIGFWIEKSFLLKDVLLRLGAGG